MVYTPSRGIDVGTFDACYLLPRRLRVDPSMDYSHSRMNLTFAR